MMTRSSKYMPLFVIILLAQLGLTRALWALDKQAEGMSLIKHAVELTDLHQGSPYVMRSSLTVRDETLGERGGKEVITFSSIQQWRRDLHMTGYDEVAVFIGHNMYRSRSLSFTPPSLRTDIAGSLRNLPETLSYKVIRVFNRKMNEVELRCVYLQQKADQPAEVTWCFDPHSGLPWLRLSGNGSRRIEFLNYKPFGKKFVPGSIEVTTAGKPTGKAVIDAIESGIPDIAHQFDPPAGSSARPWCDDMEGPRPVAVARPDLPLAMRSRAGLELNYELTVDAKGNVTDVVPMAAKPFADRIAIDTMRSWQLKPATCDGAPAPTDMWIDVRAMMPY
jgi:hypothetical protein